jgi:hypothetical protein
MHHSLVRVHIHSLYLDCGPLVADGVQVVHPAEHEGNLEDGLYKYMNCYMFMQTHTHANSLSQTHTQTYTHTHTRIHAFTHVPYLLLLPQPHASHVLGQVQHVVWERADLVRTARGSSAVFTCTCQDI